MKRLILIAFLFCLTAPKQADAALETADRNTVEETLQAASLLDANRIEETEALMRILRAGIEKLSPEGKRQLDKTLFGKAETSYESGQSFAAIERYKELLNKALNN